jgi:hypothetical protein
MILTELALTRKSYFRHIASSARLSTNALAQVIHNDKMKAGVGLRACKRRAILRKDPVKHFNELKHAHNEACFFKQLTRYALLQRFSELQCPSRNGPLAAERFATAANQQRAPIVNDYASNTDYWTLGIFAG